MYVCMNIVHTYLHAYPFLSQAEVINCQASKSTGITFLDDHHSQCSVPILASPYLKWKALSKSACSENLSQIILAHLFEIKTTMEQSINKWSAIPTLLHFATLGGREVEFPTLKCTFQQQIIWFSIKHTRKKFNAESGHHLGSWGYCFSMKNYIVESFY